MPSFLYSLYGLTLQSEIPLHAPPGAGTPDLVVTSGAPRAVPAQPAEGELLCQIAYGNGGAAHVRTASGYTLRYFHTAEFEFSRDLSRVTAHVDPSAKVDLIPEFLVASIPAFKLLLSGRMVLHASAVARNSKTIGILAQSGGGKSTLAAALCQQGFAPVTDDVLALEWAGDVPHVLPGTGELRLRPGSAANCHSGESWNPVSSRQTPDGRNAVSFGSPKITKLAALITPILDPTAKAATLERLDSSESLKTILSHLRVAGWQDTPVLQRIFPEQARLAAKVTGYRLTLPWGPEGLHEATTKLQALL